MSSDRPEGLHDPQQAIEAYLDEMLDQAMDERLPERRFAPIQDPIEDHGGLTPASNPESRIDSVQGIVNHDQRERNIGSISSQQCLVFRVDDQCFSIPLLNLRAVTRWHFSLIRMPHLPPWVLGLTKFRSDHLPVVDSYHLLSTEPARNITPRYILILQDGNWGITCDQIDQVAVLDSDEVDWGDSGYNGLSQGILHESKSIVLSASRIIDHLDTLQQSQQDMVSLWPGG
ncbi:MAG: chemotaxis protein CheW [Gammaproteobacteria bacterium]|nr:chemotaxis protein CheW [Gammaproteobacteria bacterium]